MLKRINEDLTWKDNNGETEVMLKVDHYEADNSLYLGLIETEEFEPYCDLTVCLNDPGLEKDEAYVDVNNVPEAIEFIAKYNLGTDTGEVGTSGFCEYPLYKFDLNRIHEVNSLEVNEDLEDVIVPDTVAEVDVPAEDAEVPAEPIEVPAESDVEAARKDVAMGDQVNSLVNSVWDLISNINGTISMFELDSDKPEKASIIEILNNVVTDLTIDIGMLNKARELVDSEKAELIDKGEQKAEQIVA